MERKIFPGFDSNPKTIICDSYPCDIFPAEPTQEELIQKIDVEKQWTWEEEELMQAYTCKKNMDEFRRNQNNAKTNS